MNADEATTTAPASVHVLVAEDEPKTQRALCEALSLQGWQCSATSDGTKALELLGASRFDLCVLDWMLPGADGLAVLAELRRQPLSPPVLLLTARTAVEDRVRGLENGADDYLSKPFALAELLARCRALLRRRAPVLAGTVLGGAPLLLDLRTRTARTNGREIALTPREVDLLECLLRHAGAVVTRDMLQREVWKEPLRATSLDNVIDVQVARLRRKLEEAECGHLLLTLRGRGYQLNLQAP